MQRNERIWDGKNHAFERLDDILPEEITVHFAKFDVEGMEYKAILCMINRIERDRPILLIEENGVDAEPLGANKYTELPKLLGHSKGQDRQSED